MSKNLLKMILLKRRPPSVLLILLFGALMMVCAKKDHLKTQDPTCPNENEISEFEETFTVRGCVKSLHGNRTYLFHVEQIVSGSHDGRIQENQDVEIFVSNLYKKMCGIIFPGDTLLLYLNQHFNLLRAAKLNPFPGKIEKK